MPHPLANANAVRVMTEFSIFKASKITQKKVCLRHGMTHEAHLR